MIGDTKQIEREDTAHHCASHNSSTAASLPVKQVRGGPRVTPHLTHAPPVNRRHRARGGKQAVRCKPRRDVRLHGEKHRQAKGNSEGAAMHVSRARTQTSDCCCPALSHPLLLGAPHTHLSDGSHDHLHRCAAARRPQAFKEIRISPMP